MTESLSISDARNLVLLSQGLYKPHAFGSGLDGVHQAIEQLAYIQIDSISVIERAHHHSLWNRVGQYSAELLDQLIEQKQVFEYWSHAAAYLPMCDYRFSLPRKLAIASGDRHWHDKDEKLNLQVLQRIRHEGPLQAKDFARDGQAKASGWWDWKPAKKALEQLFMEGKLMAVKRQGFQKVYDLTERVLPASVCTKVPTEHEYYRYLITRYLHANGLGTASEISYLRKGMHKVILNQCQSMLADGELMSLNCQGQDYFALANVEQRLAHKRTNSTVRLLSPFDNVLIQRKRTQQLFDFDYQIECYVPQAKRQYGYFSLPLLWGNVFAGRADIKIERKTGLLLIQHLHLETNDIDAFIHDMLPALMQFARFNKARALSVKQLTSKHACLPSQLANIRLVIEKLELC